MWLKSGLFGGRKEGVNGSVSGVGGNTSDSGGQLLVRYTLLEEEANACFLRGVALRFVVVDRDPYNRVRQFAPRYFGQSIVVIAAAHFKVNEYNIGVEAFRHLYGITIVGSFTNDLYLRI